MKPHTTKVTSVRRHIIKEAVKRILNACKKNHKIAMLFTGNTNDAKKAMEDGFDSILLGLDLLVLINGYKAMLEEMK